MFEESNAEVLVSPRSFRIVRGADASQVATVDWRRSNKRSIRPMVSGRFFALRYHVKSGNTRNNEATPKQQRSQPNAFVRAGTHSNKFCFVYTRRSQGLQRGPPRNKITKVVMASARDRSTVFLIRGGIAAVGQIDQRIRMYFAQRHINDLTLNETVIVEF